MTLYRINLNRINNDSITRTATCGTTQKIQVLYIYLQPPIGALGVQHSGMHRDQEPMASWLGSVQCRRSRNSGQSYMTMSFHAAEICTSVCAVHGL